VEFGLSRQENDLVERWQIKPYSNPKRQKGKREKSALPFWAKRQKGKKAKRQLVQHWFCVEIFKNVFGIEVLMGKIR